MADFLERFVGVRWYWPAQYGGRSIPRRASLAVPPAHYRDQPVFRYRTMYQDWYWLQARSFDEELLRMPPGVLPDKETLWMGDHFRLMRQGISWPYEHVQHGARDLRVHQRGAENQRGDVRLREDGSRNFQVLCYSAPETLEFYVDGLERAWDNKGGARPRVGGITRNSMTVWTPMDLGGRSLGCRLPLPACRKTLAKGGEELLMGLFIKRLCEAGQAALARQDGDLRALGHPASAPRNWQFPDNLVVCSLNLDAMGLMPQPTVRALEEENCAPWSAKSGRPVHTWIDFASPSDWTYGPVQFPHLVQDFYLKNRNILAGTSVLSYGGACFVTAAPTYYVWRRCCGTPSWTWTRRWTKCAGGYSGPGQAPPANSCGCSATAGRARP